VFERLEQFGVALEQQILIAAAEQDEDFRIFEFRRGGRPGSADFVGKLETSIADQRVDAVAQLRGGRSVIKLAVNN